MISDSSVEISGCFPQKSYYIPDHAVLGFNAHNREEF